MSPSDVPPDNPDEDPFAFLYQNNSSEALNALATYYTNYLVGNNVIMKHSHLKTKKFTWTCLNCAEATTQTPVDEEAIPAYVTVHNQTCTGTTEDGAARLRLLNMMSGYSEYMWAAGWLNGLPQTLLAEGEPWLTLFEKYGFPAGYFGSEGWIPVEEAKQRFDRYQQNRNAT